MAVTQSGALTQYSGTLDDILAGINSYPAPAILTEASNIITAGTQRDYVVAAGTGTDADIYTVNGLTAGQWVLFTPDTGDTITFHDNSGSGTNIDLGGFDTAIVNTSNETLAFRFDGTNLVLKWVSPNVLGTKVNVATYSSSQVLTENECFGYIIRVTGAGTITIPEVAIGMSVVIKTIGNVAISIDPDVGDTFVLNGTALTAGNQLDNEATAGDELVLTYAATNTWDASAKGWVDGGA